MDPCGNVCTLSGSSSREVPSPGARGAMMPRSSRLLVRVFTISLLATALLVPSLIVAQIDTGSIVGVVKDPSGAAIVNATLTLRNEATGVSRVATTNQDGGYQFPALIPGAYSVQAAAAGFESAISKNIQIDVQSRPAIDFTLKVGQSKEVIEVSSAGPILQTETADV